MQNPQHSIPEPHSQQTLDADLASRAANGDAGAFEAIMRRHNRLLFRTARSILKSDSEAEDALQDAYLREGLASDIDVALGNAFAFDGARCDRIVAAVLVRAAADGVSCGG